MPGTTGCTPTTILHPPSAPIRAANSIAGGAARRHADAAPTPAKEFAVRTFGNADKPILVGSVAVVLVIFGAVVGLIAWRRPRVAAVAIGLLGVAGAGAALTRGPWTDALPSVVAGVVVTVLPVVGD